jgi:hypothetical protein
MKVFAQWIVFPACWDHMLTEHPFHDWVFAFIRLAESTPRYICSSCFWSISPLTRLPSWAYHELPTTMTVGPVSFVTLLRRTHYI